MKERDMGGKEKAKKKRKEEGFNEELIVPIVNCSTLKINDVSIFYPLFSPTL